ncbi:MAG TPA: hypothetical protein PLG87_00770 [Treponemataceae bacterium]|jgi:hypothetical protein|nr:hypothetical protein [Treponemataceae bacterium]
MTLKFATRIALISSIVLILIEIFYVIIGYLSIPVLFSLLRILRLAACAGNVVFFYVLLKKQNEQ